MLDEMNNSPNITISSNGKQEILYVDEALRSWE